MELLAQSAANLTQEKLRTALDDALKRIDRGIELFGGDKFPSAATRAGYQYRVTDNHDWTEGFWTVCCGWLMS